MLFSLWNKKKVLTKLLKNTQSLWRKRPQTHTTKEGEERKVYWLDLFFDLVFVVAIGQLAHLFHADITWSVVKDFVILFIPIWWTRISSTYYVHRFEELTIRHRIYMFAMMVPVLGMSYGVHGAMGELAPWFVGSYVVARLLLARMRYTAGQSQEQSEGLTLVTKQIGLAAFMAAIARLGSLAVPTELRWIVRYMIMAWELRYISRITNQESSDLPEYHLGHLSERFGLFTIIVLAEIIIGVYAGLNSLDSITLISAITALAAFSISCLLAWIYFDQVLYRPLRKESQQERIVLPRTYGHLPLTMGITALGGSLTHLLYMLQGDFDSAALIAIILSLCLVLITLGYLTQFHRASNHDGTLVFGEREHFNCHLRKSKWVAVGFLLCWGASTFFFSLSMSLFIIGVVAILLGLAVESLIHWLTAQSDTMSHDELFHSHGNSCSHT